MARDTRTIRALHWQPQLGVEGEVVEGIDDIAQSISIVLLTRKGQDPLRPEFGSDLYLAIDLPVTQAPPFAVRETVEAIERWEKRAEVQRVTVEIEGARIAVAVHWRPRGDVGDERITEVTLT